MLNSYLVLLGYYKNMGKLHIIDISIVGIYLLLCLAIGLYKSTKIKTIKEYAVGNKDFSTFTIIATIFATYISANGTVGKIEGIYNFGLIFGLALLFVPFNWLLVKNIYAKNIDQFKGCISMSEIMQKLYGNCGNYITSFILTIVSIGFISISVTAVGLLFNYFFGFDYATGVAIGIGILTVYSLLGGVRAVALTDVFQFLIFFIALPIACGIAYHKAGGYDNIINSIPKSHLTIFNNANSIVLFLSYAFWIILPAISAPYVQRLLMAKNTKQLMNSYNVLMALVFFFAVIIFVLGFSIRTIYPNIEGKMALYTFIGSLSPVFVGIMVTGMLAVIMSTADSWLNSLSVIISHDVIKNIFPKINEKQEILTARVATCVCAVLAIIIALKSKEILKLVIVVNSFSYTTILLPFTLGFFKFKTNSISFLTSVMSGIIGTILAKFWVGEFGVVSMAIGTFGSALGFFVAHYLQVNLGIIKIEKSIYQEYKLTLHQKIKRSVANFIDIKRKVEISKTSYYIFALFIMALNIPVLILGYNNINNFVNIVAQYSRYTALFLALLLMMNEFFTNKVTIKLWNLILFLTLPFFSTYLFISSGYKLIWGVNCVVSIFALLLFANLFYAWILGILGVLTAITLYLGCSLVEGLAILNKQINTNLFAAYSIVLLLLIVFHVIYHRFREDKTKQRTLEILSKSIAHDMNTPLSIGLMSAELIEKALENNNLEYIKKYVKNLKECNKQAIQDIDVLLSNTKIEGNTKPRDWGQYSVIKCINDALEKYHIDQNQRKRIFFLDKDKKNKDFKFVGSATLLKYIIFNLLKNALKYSGDKAKIEIFIKNNKLHFKDNGVGIKKEILADLFQKYITTEGYGIGLNFCKEAMLKMGGDITCNSIEGKETEFVISFN